MIEAVRIDKNFRIDAVIINANDKEPDAGYKKRAIGKAYGVIGYHRPKMSSDFIIELFGALMNSKRVIYYRKLGPYFSNICHFKVYTGYDDFCDTTYRYSYSKFRESPSLNKFKAQFNELKQFEYRVK